MAKIIEARLTDEFIGSEEIPGIIHSKFRTVLNILFRMPEGDSRLITIITPGTKGIPDSITVPEEYFARISLLPVGTGLLCKNLNIYFKSISEILKGNIQCLRKSGLVIKSTAEKKLSPPNFARFVEVLGEYSIRDCRNDGFSVFGGQRKTQIALDMQNFGKAWMEHDIAGMEAMLLKNIGLGIGLTPSCDDAFIGIIAVYSAAKLYSDAPVEKIKRELRCWKDLPAIGSLTPFTKLLFNRTTDVSLKYLCCSQEGRFSDAVIDLMRTIFSGTGENLETCIKSVSLAGESSGMDMLFGTEIACRELGKSIGLY